MKSCHRGTHSHKNHVGETTFIPKITWPTTMKVLFSSIHRQFLIKVILAMIISKSQGQYVKYVGPNLRTLILSHWQLYVVLYWATSSNFLIVFLLKFNIYHYNFKSLMSFVWMSKCQKVPNTPLGMSNGIKFKYLVDSQSCNEMQPKACS
jgi:hypothetical protein